MVSHVGITGLFDLDILAIFPRPHRRDLASPQSVAMFIILMTILGFYDAPTAYVVIRRPSQASPPSFVWEGGGFMGTETHLPPKFLFSSDFGHFILKMLENAKFEYVSRKKDTEIS